MIFNSSWLPTLLWQIESKKPDKLAMKNKVPQNSQPMKTSTICYAYGKSTPQI